MSGEVKTMYWLSRMPLDLAHADVVAFEIEAQHFRDAAQAKLARAVRGMPGQAEEPRGR